MGRWRMDPFERKPQQPEQPKAGPGEPLAQPSPGISDGLPLAGAALPPPPPVAPLPPPPGPSGVVPTSKPDLANEEARLVEAFFNRKRKTLANAQARDGIQVDMTRFQRDAQFVLDHTRDRFPGPAVTTEEIDTAWAALNGCQNSDHLKRMLGHLPFYGRGPALVAREDELPEELSIALSREEALDTLAAQGLAVQIGQGWGLTQAGAGVCHRLRSSDWMADHVLDAQMATLSARLSYDPNSAGPFIEAAGHLLVKSRNHIAEGHPTWWGAASRSIHNAVVMDLDRPGNLLPNGGGISTQAFQAMSDMVRKSPLASGGPEADFQALQAALAARERIRDQVTTTGLPLEDILLSASTYQQLRDDLTGLRSMAHAAWVHLARGSSADDTRVEMAVALARAVTGRAAREPMKSSDLALLTPDHREHVVLAVLYEDGDTRDRLVIESTPEEARRRLASLYGPIDRDYPALSTKLAAGIRILQLHDCYREVPDQVLEQIVRRVFGEVEDARDFGTELMSLAQGIMGQPLNNFALADLIRDQMHMDVPLAPVPESMALGEWVAVQERFASFRSMEEANLYRFAMMEYASRERERLDEVQRGVIHRMLKHATSIMALLAQQEQIPFVPETEKAILAEFTTDELKRIIEGDGGHFGVARVPWLESERESHWRRMVQVMNLRVDFTEDLNRVTSALMQILGTHVAPGIPGDPQEVGQRLIAEANGLPPGALDGLDAQETSEILAFVQATSLAQRAGILVYHGEDGVTTKEAITAHVLRISEAQRAGNLNLTDLA